MKQIFYFLMCVFCLQAQGQVYPIELEGEYDEVGKFKEGIAETTTGNNVGGIDRFGKEIRAIPSRYSHIEYLDCGLLEVCEMPYLSCKDSSWEVRKKEYCGFMDREGNPITPCKYTSNYNYSRMNPFQREFEEGFSIVEIKDKKGFINEKGIEIIPCKYQDLYDFSEELAAALLGGKWGFINAQNQTEISFMYEEALSFSNECAGVKLNDKWGFIDKKGNIKIPFKFEDVFSFECSVTWAKIEGKYGLINTKGKFINNIKYNLEYYIYDEVYGVFVVMNDEGKWGVIDTMGKEVTQIKYDILETEGTFLNDFQEGTMIVSLNYKQYGYMDTKWKEIIPCKYEDVRDFSESRASVKLNGKWGFIDKTGKEITPCKYDDTDEYFSEGLASVKLNDKWGFIDKKGNEVATCKYEEVRKFSEGLAGVKLNDKWGFIDKTGKEITSCKYEEIWDFLGGLAEVKLNGKIGYIDKTGKEVIPCKYDYVYNFCEELAGVKLNKKWGYLDKTGKEIIPFIYDKVTPFSEGIAAVKKDGKWYLIENPLLPKCTALYYLTPDISNCPYGTCASEQETYALKLGYQGDKTLSPSDLRIFVNGTEQKQEEKTITRPLNTCGNGKVVCVSVKLSVGINEIEIKVGDKTTGILKVRYNVGKPTLYFCGVGVSYKGNNFVRELNYTEQDVRDIYNLYEGQTGDKRIFADVSPLLLTQQEQKTYESGILGELTAYGKQFERGEIRSHDVFILYVSGHGMVQEDKKFYLLCQDYSTDKPDETTISEDELWARLDKIKCKKLVFIDACRAMGGGDGDSDKSDDAPINQAVEDLMMKLPGTTVFLSCQDGEKSKEKPELQNGVFTYILKEGLQGKADSNQDGLISIGEIKTYLETNVPIKNPSQHPYIKLNELGDDTKIFVVK